jgi:hypothetical protein
MERIVSSTMSRRDDTILSRAFVSILATTLPPPPEEEVVSGAAEAI